ncbi:MAG TPA: hypothetical protein VJH25_02120, partial [Candidatus Paceibacterota bacterium]
MFWNFIEDRFACTERFSFFILLLLFLHAIVEKRKNTKRRFREVLFFMDGHSLLLQSFVKRVVESLQFLVVFVVFT